MAGRCDPTRLIEVDATLARRQASAELRQQILHAAIRRLQPTAGEDAANTAINGDGFAQAIDANPTVLAQLLLRRARLWLERGEAQSALLDFHRLAEMPESLTADMQAQIQFGQLRAELLLGDPESAIQTAQRILRQTQDQATRSHLVELFLAAARRDLAAEQTGRAKVLRDFALSVVGRGEPLSVGLTRQLRELGQRIEQGPGAALPPAAEDSAAEPVEPTPGTPPTAPTSPPDTGEQP
jgi:tetratricopeptide (TPR) repeat protein